MANMVWAIEKVVPLPTGVGAFGAEAAYETRGFLQGDFERRHGHLPTPPPGAACAHIRYEVMTTVGEHWIPMIPVHRAGDNREVQLQRAAMPRVFDGDLGAPQPAGRPEADRSRGGGQRPGLRQDQRPARSGGPW